MATIKTSGIVSEIRGKMGGTVFSRNKGGAYARQFVKPTNPNSPAQASNRGLFGSLMTSFRALSTPDQQTWKDNAAAYPQQNKVGDTVYLTGAQLYAKMNMVLLNAGLTPITALPASPIALTTASATQALADVNSWTQDSGDPGTFSAGIAIEVPGGAWGTDEQVQIYASPMVSLGINSIRSTNLKLVANLPVASFVIAPMDTYGLAETGPLWKAVYGNPPAVEGLNAVYVETYLYSTLQGYKIPLGAQRYTFVSA